MPSDNYWTILDDIINDFIITKFENLFRTKNETYIPVEEELPKSLFNLDTKEFDNFENIQKIGEMQCHNGVEVVVITCFVENQLTERSSKKAQYLIGKRILRYLERYTGGFFIFYDSNGSFRFSFIYCLPQADGTLKWNNFRRYTYFVSKDQTNKTFKQQIGQASFDTINAIIDAFSVAKVTKEFYKEIVQLYNILITDSKIGIQKYPNNDDKEKEEFGVRLLGRLLFCWFLKKKKDVNNNAIITDELLSSKIVDRYNDFLHELLEPLFFQVLNTPLEERMDIYKQEPWNKIPFLNGGLFEPHESDYYQPNCLGISQNINIVRVDNSWFKNVFKLFEQYNFTIDENSTVDAEISIDPEMLGRIFENLLAEINPETGESARKLTGSYYTPREIVEYMVNESLRRYLIEKTCLDEETIDKLLQYDDEDIELTQEQIDKIIDALDEIKVIDPACGSGAFPMGVLHKMVSILQKVDPKSTKWLGKKINQIPDPLIRQELEQKIKGENWDYIHKLGIIQNSIYGVDIQPIATEISKLRFFLSLIVDESIDDNKPNRGIIPLPNLEFKFVTANTLIGLPKFDSSFGDQYDLIEKLKNIRNQYFTSFGVNKKKLEDEFKKTQKEMLQYALIWFDNHKISFALTEWDPFSFKASKWFDPEWMFGIPIGKKKMKNDWQVYNITWVTHNSRRLQHYEESNTEGLEPVLLDYEGRCYVAKLLADRIKEKGYIVVTYNVLDDHVHVLLVCNDNEVSKIVGDLKGYSSYMYGKNTGTHGTTHGTTHGLTRGLVIRGLVAHENTHKAERNYPDGTISKLWAKGYNVKNITTDEHWRNSIEYINNNHLKHELPQIDKEIISSALTNLDKIYDPILINHGFDIVIGNPPYIQLQKNRGQLADLYKDKGFETFDRKGDIYCLFYEKGLQILKPGGYLCFITSNKWMRAGYGEKIRNFFLKYNPVILVDLGPGVFESATV
ncbi:MAG: Eco57I restriction-modification methylase domain-containing protein, partial [Spirochaetota bacterium]